MQDVLIVGGGPAGLAAALALRARGAAVTVVDSMTPPIDKACGEGLMPDSLRDLARLGVTLTAADGSEFRGIRFVDDAARSMATAQFPAGKSGGSGIGVPRLRLHSRLVACAQDVGVRLRWGTVVELKRDGLVTVAGEPAQYGWLVGADGANSRVRRWAGLERGSLLSKRFGFRRHFRVEPWSPYVEVYWAAGGQAYVTPVGPNEVCVAGVVRDPHCRLDKLLNELPGLHARLGGAAAQLDRERGAITLTRRLRRVAARNVALVGDASGSVDAITGEGMGLAFRQAQLLSECLDAGHLSRYNRLHPEILRLPQTMARVMLMMDRSAFLRRRAIGMLSAEPAIFTRSLGLHLGEESLLEFSMAKGLEVAFGLLQRREASAG